MIFSNDGLTQISGNPITIAQDLCCIIKSIHQHALRNGGTELDANRLISFAGRLSIISDKDRENFFAKIPQNYPICINDIIDNFDKEFINYK